MAGLVSYSNAFGILVILYSFEGHCNHVLIYLGYESVSKWRHACVHQKEMGRDDLVCNVMQPANLVHPLF